MPPIGYILTIMLVSFATWSILLAIETWLKKEENRTVKLLSTLLWTGVLIGGFYILFGSQAGMVSAVTCAYRFLAIFAIRNRQTDEDDDKGDNNKQ